jgi:hypothetical protein
MSREGHEGVSRGKERRGKGGGSRSEGGAKGQLVVVWAEVEKLVVV